MVRLAIIDDDLLRRTALVGALGLTRRYRIDGHSAARSFDQAEMRFWSLDGAVIAIDQAPQTLATVDSLLDRFKGLTVVGCVTCDLRQATQHAWARRAKVLVETPCTDVDAFVKTLDKVFRPARPGQDRR